MADDEGTQQTNAGHTIPVPSKDAVLADLRKVAKKKQSNDKDAPSEV